MKKIIIVGFPHSGTTLLKCIMSRCDNIYTSHLGEERSVSKEMINNAKKNNKDFCLIKWVGFFHVERDLKDYIKIYIIRNPYYSYSSLCKRFDKSNFGIGSGLSIPESKRWLDIWYYTKYKVRKKIPNLYHIKYEEMFDNNYQVLRNIFDNIGLKYPDKIFDNSLYFSPVHPSDKKEEILNKTINDTEPKYKTWQVNQLIKNMNYPEKLVNLPKNIKEELDKLKIVRYLKYKCE